MKGCPVGESRALSRSPKQKMSVMPMRNIEAVLTATLHVMAIGMLRDASCVSSLGLMSAA